MKYSNSIFKLAEKFEIVLKNESDSQAKELLAMALKANEGKGIQIYFKGQHFGWYKWNPKTNKHEQFSIADYKSNDTVGELENDVKKLDKVNLEDFLPVIAGRKQV